MNDPLGIKDTIAKINKTAKDLSSYAAALEKSSRALEALNTKGSVDQVSIQGDSFGMAYISGNPDVTAAKQRVADAMTAYLEALIAAQYAQVEKLRDSL